jgi:putative nucleotidyltransferase with HDIG domain
MNKKWRDAAIITMRSAADTEQNENSRDLIPGESSTYTYRWEHVSAVVALARKLAHILDADEEVVEAAAWLHDITKVDGESHAETGAEFARVFLAGTDFPQEKIDEVAQAIADHKGLWRETPLTNLSSQILWDADKLSKLGLTAVIHWSSMILTGEQPITTSGLITLQRNLEWQGKTVESLHTKPARRAAKQRLKEVERFWNILEAELGGDDLLP